VPAHDVAKSSIPRLLVAELAGPKLNAMIADPKRLAKIFCINRPLSASLNVLNACMVFLPVIVDASFVHGNVSDLQDQKK
jgi:hypothetical protein